MKTKRIYQLFMGLAAAVVLPPAVRAQVNCNAGLIATPQTVNCGNRTIAFQGFLVATTFDFNTGTLPAGWSSSPYTVGQPCVENSPDNTNYFWATTLQTTGPLAGRRFVQTSAVNVSAGGNIVFKMRYGTDDPKNASVAGCEDPDLIAEGVFLQYSINGGSTFVNINLPNQPGGAPWNQPNSANSGPLYDWTTYTVAIPAVAQTSNVIFRWLQNSNSGTAFDNWGLEDITIQAAPASTPTYSWAFGDGTTASTANPSHTYATAGTYSVGLTISFPSCNATASTTVTVVADNTIPVITATGLATGPFNTSNDGTGNCATTANIGTPAASDNCTLTSVVPTVGGAVINPATYPFPVGNTVVTWTATDNSGNTNAINQTVTVLDNEAPVITAPAAVAVSAGTNCQATGVNLGNATVSDNCTPGTPTNDAPATFPLGATTVTWTITDGGGNTASSTQIVTVTDNAAPIPDVAALPAITGECNATASAAPTATDNCAGTITGTTSDPLTYNAQGTYTITWTYTDGNGNSGTQQQAVIVDDVTSPVTPTLADVTGECTATATPPATTDNCAGSVTGTTTDPLSYSAQGTYVIHWTFNDGNGNTTTANQNVVVDDITPPVAPTLANVTGQCSATATPPTATDNCAGTVTGTTTDPLSYTTQGTHVIHWSFNDGNGNIATANQNVIISDVTAPVPNIASLPAANGQCSVTLTAPTATDNCSGVITGTTPSPLTYTAQGTYTVTWTYNDGNGNSTTQQQTVTVQDNIAPVPNVASLPSVTGQCSATVSTAPKATDNCTGQRTATTTNPLTYTAQGDYTITWTYSDGNGNTSTQTQTVSVRDNIKPVVTAPAAKAACNGAVSSNAYTLTASATDNCAVTKLTWVIVPASGTPAAVPAASAASGINASATANFSVGTYTITWTATDIAGNTSTASTTVTINPLPVASYTASNADAFCNAVELTGASTITGSTFSWSSTGMPAFSATTQTIRLKINNTDGLYTLVVKSPAGCSSAPVTYNFQKQTLVSMYVLLGMKEVDLNQNNDVYGGSVGVTSSHGDANFDKYSSVASTGAFVKADDIHVQSNVTIPNKIYSPAVVTLPTMLLNTSSTSGLSNYSMTSSGTVTGNKKDLTISSNKTVTITGNIFRKIRVNHDATVTFTSSDISLEKLELEQGVTVYFSGNTNIRVSDEVDIDKECTVNPGGKKVTFYVKDPGSSNHDCFSNWFYWHSGSGASEKFIVDGKNTKIMANVYMPNGKLRVHGNGWSCNWGSTESCTMIGLFIAEEIQGDGKNITWSSYDCNAPATFRLGAGAVQEEEAATYSVLIYPNPTSGQFNLQFAQVKEAAQVRVLDVQGRLVMQRVISVDEMPSASFDLAGKSAGVYLVEVAQGNKVYRNRIVLQ